MDQEEKLDKQIAAAKKRYRSDRIDMSFGELTNLYGDDELIIKPEYQRLYKWSAEQKTAFIESLILGIPIPPIFVFEKENGHWELLDGIQRLTTFISFLGKLKSDFDTSHLKKEEQKLNHWKLLKTDLINAWDKIGFSELKSKYQLNLRRATCKVEILKSNYEESEDIKHKLFKRLNSSRLVSTSQKVKNTSHGNKASRFNEMLAKLAKNKHFTQLAIFTDGEKAKKYDQKVVLRVIALSRNSSESIHNHTDKYANDFLKSFLEDKSQDEAAIDKIESDFLRAIKLLHKLNMKEIFQRGIKRTIPTLVEGIMVGTIKHIDYYETKLEILKAKVKELREDQGFLDSSGSKSGSRQRVKARIQIVEKLFKV